MVLDVLVLLGLEVFVLYFSGAQAYTFLHTPDSEFYVTLSAFGEHITDRAPNDVYYWTKLGVIAPQYLVSHFFGFGVAHAVFRATLLFLILASGYVVARATGSILLASLGALFLGLNTVVLGFLGDPYMTGPGIAALAVLFAALYVWPALSVAGQRASTVGIGLVFGWMVMINPYILVLSIPTATLFMTGNITFRSQCSVREGLIQVGLVLLGFWISFSVFLFAGTIIFPDLGWVETLSTWTRILKSSDYASDTWGWMATETSLLVPLTCAIVALLAWALSRRADIGTFALAISTTIAMAVAFTWVTGGPTLEASFYSAFLWPTSMLGLVAVLTRASHWGRSRVLGFIAAAAAAAWVYLGHWAGQLQFREALAIVCIVVGATLLLMWPALYGSHSRAGETVHVARVAIALALLGEVSKPSRMGDRRTQGGFYWAGTHMPKHSLIRR